ncbi:MAG: DUF4239 domain-containing protein [Candidatus Pacebacteria bacterium]|nr:DUF4239 domain-containing protein [Candidatus Paceibacterota bacterium]
MKLIKKLLPFAVVFSALFYFIRTSDFYNTRILIASLGGVPWLYAAVGTLFSIIAAFVIQKEWEQWNNLVDAVKTETDGLEKLYLWSNNFPEAIRAKVHDSIAGYLEVIIKEGWQFSERGVRSQEIEDIFNELSTTIYKISATAPQLMTISFALFSRIMESRSKRLLYSSEHIPDLLNHTMRFGAFLLIGLSMFIGVANVWLAYLFTISIACLAYSVFVVLSDLNRPLEPGDWHITTKDYEDLLVRIQTSDSMNA